MGTACRHTDCEEPAAGDSGRYCELHDVELAVVLSMLDEMRHVPDETPE
jgi:hypothetical protein